MPNICLHIGSREGFGGEVLIRGWQQQQHLRSGREGLDETSKGVRSIHLDGVASHQLPANVKVDGMFFTVD